MVFIIVSSFTLFFSPKKAKLYCGEFLRMFECENDFHKY
jgi:hypothetical protein